MDGRDMFNFFSYLSAFKDVIIEHPSVIHPMLCLYRGFGQTVSVCLTNSDSMLDKQHRHIG